MIRKGEGEGKKIKHRRKERPKTIGGGRERKIEERRERGRMKTGIRREKDRKVRKRWMERRRR